MNALFWIQVALFVTLVTVVVVSAITNIVYVLRDDDRLYSDRHYCTTIGVGVFSVVVLMLFIVENIGYYLV